jgi:peroxin-1
MLAIVNELVRLFDEYASRSDVALLVVASSLDLLHPILKTSQFFNLHIRMHPPDAEQRRQIINLLLAGEGTDANFDSKDIARAMEGYLPADIHALLCRIKSRRWPINTASVLDAMKSYTPLHLAGAKPHSTHASWSDIGGMWQTKKLLQETLHWPTKYAPIFAQCQLKLRSGILLYGPPGCGKTLIASAIAAECDLKFITVKGPELLNKYIGASEQATRDIFERAKAARPCILFFDEFDAIAPKRGHDNTGVTDRVVNQLLTLLDGAEDRQGVFVLAATNRPDLIDPALLRPGRLDKSIYCGLPTREERYDILERASSLYAYKEQLDLKALAEETEGWTGADLHALLSNTQLEAIHEMIDVKLDKMSLATDIHPANAEEGAMKERYFIRGGSGDLEATNDRIHRWLMESDARSMNADSSVTTEHANKPRITKTHLQQALSQFRPSLPEPERQRFEQIYDHFLHGRVVVGKQKATLA